MRSRLAVCSSIYALQLATCSSLDALTSGTAASSTYYLGLLGSSQKVRQRLERRRQIYCLHFHAESRLQKCRRKVEDGFHTCGHNLIQHPLRGTSGNRNDRYVDGLIAYDLFDLLHVQDRDTRGTDMSTDLFLFVIEQLDYSEG